MSGFAIAWPLRPLSTRGQKKSPSVTQCASRAVEIRCAADRGSHVTPVVCIEQQLRGPGANLSLSTHRIHRRVLGQPLPIRLAQHVDVVEDDESRPRAGRCSDQVLHVARQELGPHFGAVGRVHAVIDDRRAGCGFRAELLAGCVTQHRLGPRRNACRRSLRHAHLVTLGEQPLGQQRADLARTEHNVTLPPHVSSPRLPRPAGPRGIDGDGAA